MCVCVCVNIGADYETPSDCCFAAGEREATCNITIGNDTIAESDEMFNITLNPSSVQCICEDANIKVTIQDMQCKLKVPFNSTISGISWLQYPVVLVQCKMGMIQFQ